MNLIEYPDRELMMISLADNLAAELRLALQLGPATFSVPGGTTPGPVFDILSGLDLDWGQVSVLLNDERWVPEGDPLSNTRLLRERLLRNRAAAARLVPLYADAPTPEEGLPGLLPGVEAALPITVLLLGMGADMHTASLFPGAEEALAPDAPALMAVAADVPRVTLTARVLRDAMHCHVLITGGEKRAAIERAETLSEAEAPIRVVLKTATIHWAP
ncbi:6-phosphogluconolactonase [Paenirhodobacter sp.]|uniref:6-phosphogluconolactonase n=1 Tax=Paenirhodobacter sp. TaxID=1965326 RepID=UPI003B423B3D